MLSTVLRIEMILLALAFIVLILSTVSRKKLQVRHSLVWLFLALILMVMAIFPQTAGWAAALVRIETPSNLIYLLGIFFLLILAFSHTVSLSKQADKLKRIVQVTSIERFFREEREKREGQGEDDHA